MCLLLLKYKTSRCTFTFIFVSIYFYFYFHHCSECKRYTLTFTNNLIFLLVGRVDLSRCQPFPPDTNKDQALLSWVCVSVFVCVCVRACACVGYEGTDWNVWKRKETFHNEMTWVTTRYCACPTHTHTHIYTHTHTHTHLSVCPL